MSSLLVAWKRLFDRPSANDTTPANDIRAWQKVVLDEHEGLREELEVLLRTYVRTVDRFVERATELSEEQRLQEQYAIESIRKILQNAIRRLEVSCKDHRELLDEWHEWVAFRRAAGQKHELDPAHRLRIEMIRSELTARDIKVEDPMNVEEKERVSQHAVITDVSIPAPEAPVTVSRPTQPELDELVDWMELRQTHIEPEWQAAEQAWNELASEAHLYPEAATAALKRLKEAHADLRLLDRARRQQRHRVAVFERWSVESPII